MSDTRVPGAAWRICMTAAATSWAAGVTGWRWLRSRSYIGSIVRRGSFSPWSGCASWTHSLPKTS